MANDDAERAAEQPPESEPAGGEGHGDSRARTSRSEVGPASSAGVQREGKAQPAATSRSLTRAINQSWRFSRNFLRELKPFVEVSVPIALVWFALRTDKIQDEQKEISKTQAAIAAQQARIANAQNLAAFTFQYEPAASSASAPLYETVHVFNEGAVFADARFKAFSYFPLSIGSDPMRAEDWRTIPILGTLADVRPTTKATNEVAAIRVPFEEAFRWQLSQRISLMVLEPAISKTAPVPQVLHAPVTIVEIRYRDRGGERHYLAYRSNGPPIGWQEIPAAMAMTDWMLATAANATLHEKGEFLGDEKNFSSFGGVTCCGPSAAETAQRVEFIAARLPEILTCPIYQHRQRDEWLAQLEKVLAANQKDFLDGTKENAFDATFTRGSTWMRLSQWITANTTPLGRLTG